MDQAIGQLTALRREPGIGQGMGNRPLVVERCAEDQLAEARKKIENLEIALQTSRHIGMALGILMSRHALAEDAAFLVLRRISQERHRKIRDIAEDVIYTGDLELPHWPSEQR